MHIKPLKIYINIVHFFYNKSKNIQKQKVQHLSNKIGAIGVEYI